MKAEHKIQVELTPEELAEALANCSPSDFGAFWARFGEVADMNKLDTIAKDWWKGFHRGKEAFKKFNTMIEYHEMKQKSPT